MDAAHTPPGGTGCQERIATRMEVIAPFHVMEVMTAAQNLEKQGRDVVHMEVGEPDFATAAPIVEAGIAALRAGHTHYTLALGLEALREAIAAWYGDYYGVPVPAEQVVITTGASGAFQLALLPLLNPGDEVIMSDPGYPGNRHIVQLAGGVPVTLPVDPADNWQLTADAIAAAITPRTRAVMLASPSNPTGTMVDAGELAAICALLARHGIALVCDEIYHGLTYNGRAATAAAHLADHPEIFVINSFSKYFGMTGWRLGWLIVPPAYLRAAEKLAQNLFISAPTPAQYAALAAFTPQTQAILEQRRQAFAQRRDFLLPALRQLGFGLPLVPEGAFYLYANVRAFGRDSQTFARQVIEQTGVAMTPGVDFGRHRADDHLRIAYTTDLPRLRLAVERLAVFLA